MTRGLRTALMLVLLAGAPTPALPDNSKSWDWLIGMSTPPGPPPSVDYLGLDGFDVSKAYVQSANSSNVQTICYLSVGTLEDWRPDVKAFEALNEDQKKAGKPKLIGRRYPDWPDERWLNFKRYKVFLPLMVSRLERCATKGFGLVEFDNLDAHENRTGFRTKAKHVVAYATALAVRARKLDLIPVQKNATDLNRKLEPHFGALLLEDCALYRFCGDAKRYRKAGKPVFAAEYPRSWKDEGKTFKLRAVCRTAQKHDIALIAKKLNLKAWIRHCR